MSRAKSPAQILREQLAVREGVKPESVRKREYRETHKGQIPIPRPQGTPLRTLGMELSEEFLAKVNLASGFIDAAQKSLQDALRQVAKMSTELGKDYPPGVLERLKEGLRGSFSLVKGCRPWSLCPWCKGTDAQDQCSACEGTGYIVAEQKEGIPAELLDEEQPAIVKGGVYVALSSSLPTIDEDVFEGPIDVPEPSFHGMPAESDDWGLADP